MAAAPQHVTVIGAGIGGLASALRLAHAGLGVTVLERHATPGGKMRTLPTPAGPVDAGPTVLTMKPVFERLFADVGERLCDHATLSREHTLARHFWPDGTMMDLTSDPSENRRNISDTFGAGAAREFENFTTRARVLFEAFEGPMMQSAVPSQAAMTTRVLRQPSLIAAMAPHLSLSKLLKKSFKEPRLAQLFARYATYVGGLPDACPAILALIWHAEAQGVWHVDGGMHQLACAIEQLAASKGADFQYNAHVKRIEVQDGRVSAVHTDTMRLQTDAVLFNGDPRALQGGHLGPGAAQAVPSEATNPRSLSAYVLSFAAQPAGLPLSAHNVLFADDPDAEYKPLHAGQMQHDPTLYICAQDRFGGNTPTGLERFEVIMNAPPLADDAPVDDASIDGAPPSENERQKCQTLVLDKLRNHALTFDPRPAANNLTLPAEFAQLFPASTGSLYGRSPHGMMAAFKRPTARTKVQGLYLTGGGAHPGAGVPMAALSAQAAAAAILSDLTSTSTSPQAATPGGTLTGSATTEPAQSRS